MKTKPTDIDREAGSLFVVASGTRYWLEWWFYGQWLTWSKSQGNAIFHPRALDTDDPTTIRRMLSQFLEECDVKLQWVTIDNNGGSYCVRASNGTAFGTGPTRGAAIVAAMRAIKKDNGKGDR